MKITKECVVCGKTVELDVPVDGYNKWLNREAHIQDAMPELTADQREMLLSGICPSCWDKMFKEDE